MSLPSDTFCIMPWIHVHTTPTGSVGPCCIAQCHAPDSEVKHIGSLVNSSVMKEVRRQMLNGEKPHNCQTCYHFEEQGHHSARNSFNQNYGHYATEIVPSTSDDGYLANFKMRYYDMRFSNICNFKCRSCNSEHSSKWQAENKNNPIPKGLDDHADFIPHMQIDEKEQVFEDVLKHVPYMTHVYFAGGEPLLMPEHYRLLDAIIAAGRTDIQLSYNTNASDLRFNGYDLLEVWNKFDKKVIVDVSLDHHSNRAEYIRHGTVWDEVKANVLKLKQHPNVDMNVAVVVSALNYPTFKDFLLYLNDIGIIKPESQGEREVTLNILHYPEWMSVQILPKEIKEASGAANRWAADWMDNLGYHNLAARVRAIIEYAEAEDKWDQQRVNFLTYNLYMDVVRREYFYGTFPELRAMN